MKVPAEEIQKWGAARGATCAMEKEQRRSCTKFEQFEPNAVEVDHVPNVSVQFCIH
jgi:hypothetical protein